MVALARSWRPAEVLPGARTWVEAQAASQEALSGLQGHLAIEPPPNADGFGSSVPPQEPSGSAPAAYRLRLAVAAAARDGDQDATATLVRQAPTHGIDVAELVAVAEAHWPKPRLHRRAIRAGRRWAAARWHRLHRPRDRAPVAEPERQS
jgi:hypothetical protein